jgi:hypothetical protein
MDDLMDAYNRNKSNGSLREAMDAYTKTKPPLDGRGPTTPNWLGGGRALSPEERSRAGIDPMDPNLYWQGDNGNIIGTLMGWYRNQGEAQKPLAPKPDGMMNDTLINLLKNMRR